MYELLSPEDLVIEECTCQANEDCAELENDALCNGMLYCDLELEVPVCKVDLETIVECDDGVFCTSDTCDAVEDCVFTPDDGACDDQVTCTADTCDPVEGCVLTPDEGACDDQVGCTADVCDPVLGCVFTPDAGACDDQVACTADTCDPVAGCVFTAGDGLCDDLNDCTQDVCDPAQGCLNDALADAEPCGDVPGEQWCYQGECCTPVCQDKDCGDGGCGAACGTCGMNETCSDTGLCECTFSECGSACCDESEVCHGSDCCLPDCLDKECGDDGCGGSCGPCDEGASCQAGQCKVECGDDLCGAGEDQCNCPNDCEGGCGGCCDAAECKTGDTVSYCGSGGGACDACSDGEVCEAGNCAIPGTWTDPTSGLMWQNPPLSWQMELHYLGGEGWTYCTDLDLGGYTDWRLPTVGELRSLMRGCPATEPGGSCGVTDSCLSWSCKDGSCNSDGCLVNDGPANGCYWPDEMQGVCATYGSSSFIDGMFMWQVTFLHAAVGDDGAQLFATKRIRCVR